MTLEEREADAEHGALDQVRMELADIAGCCPRPDTAVGDRERHRGVEWP